MIESDLRVYSGFVIDPKGALEHDDGFDVEFLSNGTQLLRVFIANVAPLVPKGSLLDKETQKKAFSRYHPDHTDYMLPLDLATEKASFILKQKRPALMVTIPIYRDWTIGEPFIKECIFINRANLTYQEIPKILEDSHHKYYKKMMQAYNLARQIWIRNYTHNIVVEEAEDSHKRLVPEAAGDLIIHEFMVLTNSCIAEFLTSNTSYSLYRNHVIHALTTKKKDHTPALYEPYCRSHCGLGLSSYTHFTSPLRRYSDIIVHRIILAILHQKPNPYSLSELEGIAKYLNHASESWSKHIK